MPTLQQNLSKWAGDYDWSQGGDEWSGAWGSVDMQWWMSLLPRIHPFVPTGTILEIAPGFGRWTQYLQTLCRELIVVDLSEKCIEACRKRFSASSHLSYHVNDGRSLSMVPDRSVDFIFSFDSLVHAEADVMECYVAEIARTLRPEGAAFVHHSNLGAYAGYHKAVGSIPKGKGVLGQLGLIDNTPGTWRAPSMTAEKLRQWARGAGLRCLHQELANWNTRRLIDCMSVVVPEGSSWKGSGEVLLNPDFMKEARLAAKLARIYTGRAPVPAAGE